MIIAIFVDCGSTHDFKMWKKSIGVKVVKHIKAQADSGYQGIDKLHGNSETPKKKSKKCPLTKAEKENNHRIGSERIAIEKTIPFFERHQQGMKWVGAIRVRFNKPSKSAKIYSEGRYTTEHVEVSGEAVCRYLVLK